MSRPLHAVFTELLNDEAARQAYAADPAGFLDSAGHAELSDELVAEAVISFADTAPPAVAEHLAPFVMAHGPVNESDTDPTELDGLALLATAPGQPPGGEDLDADLAPPTEPVDTATADTGWPTDDLDFGTGSEREPAEAPAGGFDETLTEIPAEGSEPGVPAPVADEPLLGVDPALDLDAEPSDDIDTE